MTTTDPTTLAREVLDSVEYAASRFMSISDMPSIGRAAPDLALAVIAVADLADRLENYAEELEADGEDGYADAARTDAASIRAALNGNNA